MIASYQDLALVIIRALPRADEVLEAKIDAAIARQASTAPRRPLRPKAGL